MKHHKKTTNIYILLFFQYFPFTFAEGFSLLETKF